MIGWLYFLCFFLFSTIVSALTRLHGKPVIKHRSDEPVEEHDERFAQEVGPLPVEDVSQPAGCWLRLHDRNRRIF